MAEKEDLFRELYDAVSTALSGVRSLFSANTVFFRLQELEQFMRDQWGDIFASEREETEILIGTEAGIDNPQSIDELLGVLCSRITEIRSEVRNIINGEGNVSKIEESKILLPPDVREDGRPSIGISEKGMIKVKAGDRLAQVIDILVLECGIKSEIMIVEGVAPSNSLRSEPYVLIEVPSKNMQIAICNQSRNATFVSIIILDRNDWAVNSKRELLENYPNHVFRVPCLTYAQWSGDLLRIINSGMLRKTNINDRDEVRDALLENYPTSEEWLKIKPRAFGKLKVEEAGMVHIAKTVFDIKDFRNARRKSQVELGFHIYGEDDARLKQEYAKILCLEQCHTDPTPVIEGLRSQFPTSKQWLEITGRSRGEIEVAGNKISSIGRIILDKDGRFRCYDSDDWLELGFRVFGRGDELLRREKANADKRKQYEKNPELLKADVQRQFATSKAFIDSFPGNRSIDVSGLKITRISSLLMPGITFSSGKFDNYLELAICIYGEDDEFLIRAKKEKIERDALTDDRIIEIIIVNYRLDDLIQLKKAQRSLNICGLTIGKIGNILLRVSDFSTDSTCQWIDLLKRIYGDECVDVKLTLLRIEHEKTIRNKLRSIFPSRAALLQRSLRSLAAIKIGKTTVRSFVRSITGGGKRNLSSKDRIALADWLFR